MSCTKWSCTKRPLCFRQAEARS